MYFIITKKILDYINSRKTFFEFEDNWPVIGESWRIDKIVKYPTLNNGEPVIECSSGSNKDNNYRWMRLSADFVFDQEYANEIADNG